MNDKCDNCNKNFKNDEILWYCKDCKIYICDLCLKKFMKHDLMPIEYNNNHKIKGLNKNDLIGYCDDCEIFISIENMKNHMKHNITFFELESNKFPKETFFNLGGAGPCPIEDKVLTIDNILLNYSMSENMKKEIFNNTPFIIAREKIFSVNCFNKLGYTVPTVNILLDDKNTVKEIKHHADKIVNVDINILKNKIIKNNNFLTIPININNKKQKIIKDISILLFAFDLNKTLSEFELSFKTESDDDSDLIIFEEKNINLINSGSNKEIVLKINVSKKEILKNLKPIIFYENYKKKKEIIKYNHIKSYLFLSFSDYWGIHYWNHFDDFEIKLVN